jgi:hypothetical protein
VANAVADYTKASSKIISKKILQLEITPVKYGKSISCSGFTA